MYGKTHGKVESITSFLNVRHNITLTSPHTTATQSCSNPASNAKPVNRLPYYTRFDLALCILRKYIMVLTQFWLLRTCNNDFSVALNTLPPLEIILVRLQIRINLKKVVEIRNSNILRIGHCLCSQNQSRTRIYRCLESTYARKRNQRIRVSLINSGENIAYSIDK